MATQVNVYEAKTHLSALLAQVESGEDIVIARHGRPVARLVRFIDKPIHRAPGGWKGRGWIADDFDDLDEQILQEWHDEPIFPTS